MASIIDPEEDKIIGGFVLAFDLAVYLPILVESVLEFFLTSPLHLVGPGFAASPIANEVFVPAVDKSFHVVVQQIGHVRREVVHPVPQQKGVHHHVAFGICSALNA